MDTSGEGVLNKDELKKGYDDIRNAVEKLTGDEHFNDKKNKSRDNEFEEYLDKLLMALDEDADAFEAPELKVERIKERY